MKRFRVKPYGPTIDISGLNKEDQAKVREVFRKEELQKDALKRKLVRTFLFNNPS